MKHDLSITLFLLALFVLAQLVGLGLLNYDASVTQQTRTIEGVNQTVTVVEHQDTAVGARPQTTGLGTLAYLLGGVLAGTLLILLIIKWGKTSLWKAWFFLAVTLAMAIALGVLVKPVVALVVALLLALGKLFKPNLFIHNLTEVLIYSGIALLVVPMFKAVSGGGPFTQSVFLVTVLLLLISGYDAFAVWKSKHMVRMAKFQTKSKVFAGLFIPYSSQKGKPAKIHTVTPHKQKRSAPGPGTSTSKHAILGGGDIAFPLLFSGVVMESLLVNGLSKAAAFSYALIVVATTTVALFLLLYWSKKDRFYPAMPFITAGCLAGYGVVLALLAFL